MVLKRRLRRTAAAWSRSSSGRSGFTAVMWSPAREGRIWKPVGSVPMSALDIPSEAVCVREARSAQVTVQMSVGDERRQA